MCGDGRHPPDAWGHLTGVEFVMDEIGAWTCHIQADELPDKDFVLLDGAWVDMEGVEVADPVGVAWLNNRCFGG